MTKSDKIRELNDLLRIEGKGGLTMFAGRLANEPQENKTLAQHLVRSFTNFTEDNDPYTEHDCAIISNNHLGKIMFKIDYYDNYFEFGSDNPADETITKRVLTIFYADDY